MIIIKSQDGKRIWKYIGVSINYNDEQEILAVDENCVNGESDYYHIGTYETPERAAEVMADIEEHIRILEANRQIMSNANFVAKSVDLVVKQMKNSKIFTMPSK